MAYALLFQNCDTIVRESSVVFFCKVKILYGCGNLEGTLIFYSQRAKIKEMFKF